MVGEIRDLETAEMAIQAALTGHLVLSTLHTNLSGRCRNPAPRHKRKFHFAPQGFRMLACGPAGVRANWGVQACP